MPLIFALIFIACMPFLCHRWRRSPRCRAEHPSACGTSSGCERNHGPPSHGRTRCNHSAAVELRGDAGSSHHTEVREQHKGRLTTLPQYWPRGRRGGMPILAFAGCRHWVGTPRWLSDALFTSLYASFVPAGVMRSRLFCSPIV